ncbi:MAG: hypothetical protein J6A04_01430 [Clostridia bacterium]|nr:hypothetical protein [Clostridia bacterium]
MRKDAGLTTTSIIIYVIAMLIVIGIIATITSFFYSNVNNANENSNSISEITKFHMYFLEETTRSNNQINEIKNTSISFTTGNTFTFQDNSIYFNHIKICEDITNLQFMSEEKNGKTVISVLITIGQNNEYTKTTQYVLSNM